MEGSKTINDYIKSKETVIKLTSNYSFIDAYMYASLLNKLLNIDMKINNLIDLELSQIEIL